MRLDEWSAADSTNSSNVMRSSHISAGIEGCFIKLHHLPLTMDWDNCWTNQASVHTFLVRTLKTAQRHIHTHKQVELLYGLREVLERRGCGRSWLVICVQTALHPCAMTRLGHAESTLSYQLIKVGACMGLEGLCAARTHGFSHCMTWPVRVLLTGATQTGKVTFGQDHSQLAGANPASTQGQL